MLDLSASTEGTALLPGRRPDVYAFLSDLPRLVAYLGPDVQPDVVEGPQRMRVHYRVRELGFYPVDLVIDLDLDTDPEARVLRLRSAERPPHVEPTVGADGAQGRGHLDLDVRFTDKGDDTRITYTLRIDARLPRPPGLGFVPEAWITGPASRLAAERLKEMTATLVERTAQTLRKE